MLTLEDLFNEDFYLAQNIDVATAVEAGEFSSGLEHFIEFGQFESRQPNPLFDPSYYRSGNTGVAAAIEQGETTEIFHFILFGQQAGFNPNPLFDTEFYLSQNPLVSEAVLQGELTAFEHFFKFGQFEGLNPSNLFDTQVYSELNPDIISAIEAGVINTLFEHYLRFGLAEGRIATLPIPPDNLSGAIDLDTLLGSRTIVESVSDENPADIYRFVIPNFASQVSLRLRELSADADLEVIQDTNSNHLIDFDEIKASSVNLGITSEFIDFDALTTGTYFVRVSQFEGDTDYVLELNSTPIV